MTYTQHAMLRRNARQCRRGHTPAPLQQATPKCPDSRTGQTETENGPLPDIDERTDCFRKSKLHRSQSAFSGHVQHALTTCAPWVFGGRLNRRLWQQTCDGVEARFWKTMRQLGIRNSSYMLCVIFERAKHGNRCEPADKRTSIGGMSRLTSNKPRRFSSAKMNKHTHHIKPHAQTLCAILGAKGIVSFNPL